jgi:hypothetical protein
MSPNRITRLKSRRSARITSNESSSRVESGGTGFIGVAVVGISALYAAAARIAIGGLEGFADRRAENARRALGVSGEDKKASGPHDTSNPKFLDSVRARRGSARALHKESC